MVKLLNKIYLDKEQHLSGLWQRQQFHAWKILHDLVHFRPESFQKFQQRLGDPGSINVIAPVKTTQVPMSTMNIKPSTPAENVDSMEHIFWQSGIGNLNENKAVKSLKNYVALIMQHIRSLMKSQSIEATSWQQFQFVVPVMDLFHLKMACTNAIWRIFIIPKQG